MGRLRSLLDKKKAKGEDSAPSTQAELLRKRLQEGDFDSRFDPRVKEQERLRGLDVDIIETPGAAPRTPLALSDLEGENFVTTMSDRTNTGQVRSIRGVQLDQPVDLPGGQGFMFENPDEVWASAQTPSQGIVDAAGTFPRSDRNPLLIPWRMAPTGGDFATSTGELMIQFASSNMNKTQKKALDAAIRKYKTVGSMVKGRRVGAGLKIKGWKGVDDPSSIEAWRNAPDAVRKELMNMMDVQFRDKGGLSIGEARLSNADALQLTARDAGIQNVGRIDPDKDLARSTHPSYPFAVQGEGVGTLPRSTEATVFDLLPDARFGAGQKPVGDPAAPTQQEIRALQMKPYFGKITEDILRRMEERGVDINSFAGLTGNALTASLIGAGLLTPEEAEAGIRGYHGSPAKFDQFSDEFIGTGEGAQAYGRGHYLAEVEDTAVDYRNQLTPRDYDYEEWLYAKYKEAEARQEYDTMEMYERAMMYESPDEIREIYSDYDEDYQALADEVASEIEAYGPKRGYVYQTDVDAELDDLIDYDLPLSRQSQKVQEVMASFGITDPDLKGYQLYYKVIDPETPVDQAPELATRTLNEAGIKGIRYADGLSRGRNYEVRLSTSRGPYRDTDPITAGSPDEAERIADEYREKGFKAEVAETGTSNYVIFDPRIIDIAKRYNIPITEAAAVGTGVTAMLASEYANSANAKRMQAESNTNFAATRDSKNNMWDGLKQSVSQASSVMPQQSFIADTAETMGRGLVSGTLGVLGNLPMEGSLGRMGLDYFGIGPEQIEGYREDIKADPLFEDPDNPYSQALNRAMETSLQYISPYVSEFTSQPEIRATLGSIGDWYSNLSPRSRGILSGAGEYLANLPK